MEMSKDRLSNFFCTFNDFWEDVKASHNDKGCAEKVDSYKLFLTDYLEAFRAGKKIDIDEGETRPKVVSLHFICNNFEAIGEICKSESYNWK